MSLVEPSSPTTSEDPNADVATLSYEQAREELVRTVQLLESGQAPLEEALRLWERGQALADHCQHWLDSARERLAALGAGQPDPATQPDQATSAAPATQ